MTYSGSKVGKSGCWGRAGRRSIQPDTGDGQRRAQLRGEVRVRPYWGVFLPLALLGCASSSAPAESPAETNSGYEEGGPSEDVSAEPGEGAASAPAETESASTTPASEEDLKQALQVVIQDESLLSELKLGEPGRFPLKIAGQSLSSGLELKAHSEAVEVVSAPADPKTVPVLIFTNIDITSSQGTFKYRYDVEGMRGTSYVEKNDQGVWELKSSRVSEY